MAAAFQTIPTAAPAESAFVITIDDTVVNPTNIPATGSTFANWELGQKFRDDAELWADYVFVDAVNSAPGTRAFVFGKKKTAAQKLVPFETYHSAEMYSWPAVVEKIRNVSYEDDGSVYSTQDYAIKSAVSVESVTKVEVFQDAEPWAHADLRHRRPIPDDLMLNGSDRPITCLHPTITIRIGAGLSGTNIGGFVKEDPLRGANLVKPATNFTDWAPFVIRDSQKKSSGLWVREKVTIYPPIQKTRKFF